MLQVEDKNYFAHKFILAKSSEVFRRMLYSREWASASDSGSSPDSCDGSANRTIQLDESPECAEVFDKFLKYLYTAELQISPPCAVGILCLADKYNVESLKELCVSYMEKKSRSPMLFNALNWYPWSKALHLEGLLCQCTCTLAWNYVELMKSADWLNMDLEFVEDLLKSSELVVTNEYTVWEGLSLWLLSEQHQSLLATDAMSNLLGLVRFPQMLVSQLYKVEQSALALHKDCQATVQKLLALAYRFRTYCPQQQSLGISFADPFYQPRDYTDLTVDQVRMHNTLRFGIQVDVKMYRGPVPSDVRDGDWKITYRKTGDVWSLQLFCHDSALVAGEAKVNASIIVYNEEEKVIQVTRESLMMQRGSGNTMQATLADYTHSKSMAVILKPSAA